LISPRIKIEQLQKEWITRHQPRLMEKENKMELKKKVVLGSYNLNSDPLIDQQNGSVHDRLTVTSGEITVHEKSLECEFKITLCNSETRKEFENKLVNLIQEYL
jgi:hypothetical protein